MKKIMDYLRLQWSKPTVRHYVAYLVFGGLTTLVNFGMYTLLTRAFDWPESPANATAVVVSVLFAYVTNKYFVFQSQTVGANALLSEFTSFLGGRGFTMALDIVGFYVFHNVLGFYDLLVKIILSALVIVLNYIISRFVVFRGRGVNKSEPVSNDTEPAAESESTGEMP